MIVCVIRIDIKPLLSGLFNLAYKNVTCHRCVPSQRCVMAHCMTQNARNKLQSNNILLYFLHLFKILSKIIIINTKTEQLGNLFAGMFLFTIKIWQCLLNIFTNARCQIL